MKLTDSRTPNFESGKLIAALAGLVLFILVLKYFSKGEEIPIKPTSEKRSTISDSLSMIKIRQKRIETYLEQLAVLSDEKPNKSYTSVDDIRLRIGVFQEYYRIINSLELEGIDSLFKEVSNSKKKLAQLKSKEYPIIRKEIGRLFDEKLWENDIDVIVSGKNNTTIQFVGGMFAANKNIKDFQSTASELLNLARFKRAMYRWYKHADEYTYYDFETSPDTE